MKRTIKFLIAAILCLVVSLKSVSTNAHVNSIKFTRTSIVHYPNGCSTRTIRHYEIYPTSHGQVTEMVRIDAFRWCPGDLVETQEEITMDIIFDEQMVALGFEDIQTTWGYGEEFVQENDEYWLFEINDFTQGGTLFCSDVECTDEY